MTLGEIILNYRAEHGLSQRQFAMRCGLSNGYIAMIEKNKNPATGKPIAIGLPQLMSIAKVMGMTTDELMRLAEGNTPVSLNDVPNSLTDVMDEDTRTLATGWEKMPQDKKQKLKDFLGEFFSEYFDEFNKKRGNDDDHDA